MSKKRAISLLFVMLMLVLVAGISLALGPQSLAARSATDEAGSRALVGSGFTYQGRLTDSGGNPVNDVCAFDFTLWDAETNGTLVGHQIVSDVDVDDGYMAVLLNGGGEFGERPFDGEARWLKIAVKCSGDVDWDLLPGRQLLSAAPYALSLRPGALISGTIEGRNALSIVNYGAGGNALGGYSHDADGVHGQSVDGAGVSAFSFNQVAFYGESTNNTGGFFTSTHGFGVGAQTTSDDPEVAAVEATNLGAGPGVVGYSNDKTGVYGDSVNGHGVAGFSVNEVAVYGESVNTAGFFTSTQSFGVNANTTSDDPGVAAVMAVNWGAGGGIAGYSNDEIGVYGNSTNGHGVHGFSVNEVAVYGESDNTAGFFISTNSIGIHGESVNGPAATFTSTNGPGILVEGAGLEGLRIMDPVGGDYIMAGSDEDPDFKVSNIGDVFADGSYHCALGPGAEPGTCVIQNSSADFAEMFPAEESLAPGDVLVIGPDGRLARSTQAYEPTVVGVYSTQPGYLGGGEHRGKKGYAPLAVVGIVPVKVSAENGPIHPGDLLVASATPGHAMKAGPKPPIGTVLGKALEGLDAGSGIIMMLAMLQ
jgi:hypothetical protein